MHKKNRSILYRNITIKNLEREIEEIKYCSESQLTKRILEKEGNICMWCGEIKDFCNKKCKENIEKSLKSELASWEVMWLN